jgi:hypothetical protein
MILLIAIFWALYSSFLNVLPPVLIGFKLVPIWFTALLIGVFNPATIIIAGPYLIKFMDRIESLRLLMTGVLLYLIGLAMIGLTLNWVAVIIGIIIASVGEFLVAPGYLAFVSKMAPKEKVSAYIGCNFLSTMLGITFGTIFFGLLANYVVFTLLMPYFMYGILVSIGLSLFVAFVIYYQAWGAEIIERAKKIRLMEEGEQADEMSKYKDPGFMKMFDHKLTTIIPLFFIPVILVATAGLGTLEYYGYGEEAGAEEGPTEFDADDYTTKTGAAISPEDGYMAEGSSETFKKKVEVGKGELLKSVSVMLTWEDEPDAGVLYTNQPDTFSVSVSFGEDVNETGESQSGTISIDKSFSPKRTNSKDGQGEWTIEVTMVQAGDQEGPGPLGVIPQSDGGNNYRLEVTTVVYTKG